MDSAKSLDGASTVSAPRLVWSSRARMDQPIIPFQVPPAHDVPSVQMVQGNVGGIQRISIINLGWNDREIILGPGPGPIHRQHIVVIDQVQRVHMGCKQEQIPDMNNVPDLVSPTVILDHF